MENTAYIKGRNSVMEALKAGRPIREIIFAGNIKPAQGISQIKHLAEKEGIDYRFTDARWISSQAGENNQGVIALVDSYNYLTMEELLGLVSASNSKILLMLDCIQDPRNFGSIIRTAEGAGIGGVIIPERRSAQITAVVEKASAGAISYIPVARVVNLNSAILKLKESGFWVAGLSMAGKLDYSKANLTGSLCLVLGSEGRGLRPLVEKNCDFTIRIPMMGKISSLNVSVACGIVLYESVRQRKEKPD